MNVQALAVANIELAVQLASTVVVLGLPVEAGTPYKAFFWLVIPTLTDENNE